MALEIFRLVGSVFVDTDKANKSLHASDKKAQGFGNTLVNVVKKAGQFAAGVAGAATAVGTAMVAVTENTREYRTEQGKLLTTFESSNFAAGTARKTYEELNGVLGDSGQAVEAANHLAKLCTTEADLVTWTNIATGVYATFGDSLPIEGLTEAANETAKTAALTGGLADALNWVGVNEDAFQESLDKCTTEQERQALITETLNGLYTDAAATYKEVNADVIAANKAQDKLTKTMAKLGAAAEPIITKGKELLSNVLEKAIPYVEDLAEKGIPALNTAFDKVCKWVRKGIDYVEDLADEALPALSHALDTAVGWIDDAKKGLEQLTSWAQQNKTAIQLVAIAVGAFTAAIIAYNAAQAIKRAGGIVELAQNAALAIGYYALVAAETAHTVAVNLATVATTAFSAVMSFLTSPITLVVVAIGALVAAVVLLVKNWDDVKAAALNAWEGIKSAFSGAGVWLGNVFSAAVEKVKGAWSGIQTWFSGLLTGVKDLFSSIGTAIGNIFKSPINTIISGINSFISGLNKIKVPDWVPKIGGYGFSIAQLPYLEEGALLEKGQVGILEGNGAEAVVPLHKNKKWISAVSEDMSANGLGGGSDASTELLKAFMWFVAALPEMLTTALEEMRFEMNNREFARLVKAVK